MSETNNAAPASNGEVIAQPVEEVVQNEEAVEGSEEVSNEELAAEEQKVEQEVVKQLKKKLKIKVDGEESEEEIDFDDEDSLRKHLQLSKVAQKRMNEYAQLEKEVRVFIEELKKNPKKVLADPTIGIDIKQLAAQVIEEEIENSKKTPEQIEREKLENELKLMKAEREKERHEAQRREFQRLEQQAAEKYDTMITSALNKGDLPKTPYIVKKIADYMYMGLQEGLDVTPDDVLPLVKEEMHADLKQMFSVMPEDVIEQLVGIENINKIRRNKIAKAKSKPPVPSKSAIKDVGNMKKPEVPVEKVSFKKFFGV